MSSKDNSPMLIYLKRVYEPPKRGDGFRVLVDGLWPRGVNKEKAAVDLWLKGIAPSPQLRKWFGHDSKKWDEFKTRYFRELSKNSKTVTELVEIAETRRVTLLFAARDTEHNNAVALRIFLERQFGPQSKKTEGRCDGLPARSE